MCTSVLTNLFSLPELNLLSLSFLHVQQDRYVLAIVHIDFQQKMQLISRELYLDSQELAAETSQLLPSTVLSPSTFPFADVPPILIPIPAFPLSATDNDDSENRECLGGVLIGGGRKILFYEFSTPDDQAVQKGKKQRLEKRKASSTESEVERAKEKEKQRESRKLKPRCYVMWPWSEVTSSVWTAFELFGFSLMA